IPATAETIRSVANVATFGRATTRSAATRPISITTPPIVGVPALIRCVSGPSSRTNCPNLRVCRNSMNFDPSVTVTKNAIAAPSTTLNKGQTLLQLAGEYFKLHASGTLDDHVITALQSVFEVVGGRRCVLVEERPAGVGLGVPASLVSDADEQVHAHLLGELPGFLVVGPGRSAQLEHAAEDGDEAASFPGGLLRAVAQDGGDGGRGGVVGVVVDHDIVSQPVYLAPEPRTAQARDPPGVLLEIEAEGECSPERRQHRLDEVGPEDRGANLNRTVI